VVRLTPPLLLKPVVPDPTIAPSYAFPPSVAPTKISAARYAVEFEIEYNDISPADAIANSDLLANTICEYMNYENTRCKVIKISAPAAASGPSPSAYRASLARVWQYMGAAVSGLYAWGGGVGGGREGKGG
jgi:hypothetical protein